MLVLQPAVTATCPIYNPCVSRNLWVQGKVLRPARTQMLCGAALQLIPPELVRAFPRAMLNIHPGLLPSFGGKGMYGERVHQAVVKSGARCGLSRQGV